MKKIFFLLIYLWISINLPAQIWFKTFDSVPGAFNSDIAWDILTINNDIYFTTGTLCEGNSSSCFKYYQLDKDGEILEERLYNNPEYPLRAGPIDCMVLTSDNHFAIVGDQLDDEGVREIFLMKTTLSGDSLWMKTYPGDLKTAANSVLEMDNGDFLLYVYGVFDDDSASTAIELLRTDSVGNLIWEKRLNFSDSFRKQEKGNIVIDDGHNIYITFRSTTYGADQDIAQVAKLDEFGNILWRKSLGTINGSGPRVRLCSNGDLMVATSYKANVNFPTFDEIHVRFRRLNATTGQTIWNYDHLTDNSLEDLGNFVLTPEDDIVACGFSRNYSFETDDNYWLVKISGSGELIWERVYDREGFGIAFWLYDVGLSADGHIVAGGFAFDDGFQGGGDAAVLRLNAEGCFDDGDCGLLAVSTETLPDENGVSIYPNPASGRVRVKVPQSLIGSSYELCNHLGQRIERRKLLEEDFFLDLPSSGLYSLVVYKNGVLILSRKIINHQN